MKTKILLITIACFISGALYSQIIHVPSDYNSIQEGINAATDGDTVLVAENTYYENIRFMGKAIMLASEYLLDGDSSHIVNTVIDGSQAADPDSAATVMFINGEDTTSILNGFTITGGSGVMFMTYNVRAGGGIFSYNAGCKIINNIIIENHVEDSDKAGAAGIGSVQDQGDYWIVVRENYIGYNTALANGYTAFGGGLAIMPNCYIENNLIEHNTCTNTNGSTDGGGIELEAFPGINPTAFVRSNIIQFNSLIGTTTSVGAGIICSGVTPVISDNFISANSVNTQQNAVGGGIHIKDSPGPVEITNNIIENNTLEAVEGAYGGGIRLVNIPKLMTISNNIISANIMEGGTGAWGGAIGGYNLHDIIINNNIIENNISNANSTQAGGGGINLLKCGKTSIFENEIVGNSISLTSGSFSWGGGILIDKGADTVTIHNNTINNNTSIGTGQGGGVCFYGTDDIVVDISSNYFLNNFADYRGGSIFTRNTYRISIQNNLFKGNQGKEFGGAVMFDESQNTNESHPLLVNNTFLNNTSAHGGAIYTRLNEEVPVIFNSIFWENTSPSGRDIYNYSDSAMLVYNNDIDTNMIFSPWTGADNIFCSPTLMDDSLHIHWDSECLNEGIESLIIDGQTYYCPSVDIDGDERPFDWTMPDIGADEAQWHYVKVDYKGIEKPGIEIYPNPFSTNVKFTFTLKNGSSVTIKMIDITGKIIKTILNETKMPGEYQFDFDGADLPAGIYFCVIETNKGTQSTKLIKL